LKAIVDGNVCLLLPTFSTKSLQSLKTTQIMAKQLFAVVKLQIKGGAANPAPPIGPALGAKGVNIMEFCKQFNARTQEMKDKLLPVIINVYSDKTFDFIIKRPPVAAQIKEMAKIQKGSDQSNRKKVGSITWDQVRKIAEDKLPDMNCFTVESAMKMVAGTARSMGVNVVGDNPFNKN
jgi:large subunit ribosomal protein L11